MYELIAIITKYSLTFIVYLFILRIARLIYLDIKTMTVWEDVKILAPHLKLLSSLGGKSSSTVTELYPLQNKTTIIGRSLECEIVVSDKHISSQHARIEMAHNTFTIVDLRSINGTYVNNVKIPDRTLLKNGDLISIGNTKLVFSEGGR